MGATDDPKVPEVPASDPLAPDRLDGLAEVFSRQVTQIGRLGDALDLKPLAALGQATTEQLGTFGSFPSHSRFSETVRQIGDADPTRWGSFFRLQEATASLSATWREASEHVSTWLQARAAREREGREAALSAGIADLHEIERERAEADRDALRARLAGACEVLLDRFIGAVPSEETTEKHALPKSTARLHAYADEVDRIAARQDEDGRRLRAVLVRFWEEVSRRVLAERAERGEPAPTEYAPEGEIPEYRLMWDLPCTLVPEALSAEVEAGVAWMSVREAWREENAAYLATKYVLAAEKENDQRAETALRVEVEVYLAKAREAGAWRTPGTDAEEDARDVDGMHAAEAAGADYFAALGKPGDRLRQEGSEAARSWRAKGRTRWMEWRAQLAGVDPGAPPWRNRLRFPRDLAGVLWHGEVRDRLAKEKHPALADEVFRGVRNAMWIPGRRVGGTDAEPILVDERGQVLARFNVPNTPEVPEEALRFRVTGPGAEEDLKATRSVTGQKLLRYVVERVYQQYAAGVHEPNVIEIRGGCRQLAADLGVKGGKAEDEIRRTLRFLHAAEPASEIVNFRGFLTFVEYPAAPGKEAVLRITVGDPFTPGFAARISGRSLTARQARRLVPVTSRTPPLVTPRKFHPAQYALQQEVLAELRAHAGELYADGFATIPETRWAVMAATVGLPASMLARVLDAWTAAGPDTFLVRDVERPDRFTLAQGYARELRTIREAGRDAEDGAAYQRRSAKARKPWRRKASAGA